MAPAPSPTLKSFLRHLTLAPIIINFGFVWQRCFPVASPQIFSGGVGVMTLKTTYLQNFVSPRFSATLFRRLRDYAFF